MTEQEYDVVAVGNAIVDIIRRCDDNFLVAVGARKGHMTLVNSSAELADQCKRLPSGLDVAGGSAANTAVGIASFGGKAAFIGKVADDHYGRIFRHDLKGTGVVFNSISTIIPGKETSRALVLVTPDGHRTMNTYLGCSTELDGGLIDAELVRKAQFVYLEGYLFDRPDAKAAFRRAVEIAKANRRRVALSLSDSFCVDRHRIELLKLIRSGSVMVFANECELKSLYQTNAFPEALRKIGHDTPLAVVTRSDKGSIIVNRGINLPIAPEHVSKVVDATGAGDLYAAGLLFGLARGFSFEMAGRLASFAASETITQFGARPEVRLGHLAQMRGLL